VGVDMKIVICIVCISVAFPEAIGRLGHDTV
jgi:hypothetical protein